MHSKIFIKNRPIKNHLKNGNISLDTQYIQQPKSVIFLENDAVVKANTLRDPEGRDNVTDDNIHHSRSKFHVPSLNAKFST